MRRRIEKYRKRRRIQTDPASDYNVGCILLQSPFFFQREEWIPVPDWPKQTVQGKGFSTDDDAGMRIWEEVSLRLQARSANAAEPELVADACRFGQPQMILPRLGQGAF